MQIPDRQIPHPQHLRPKGIADIVVCIDCTGSMGPCIDGVRQHVERFVDGLHSNPDLQLDWRIRLVEYRDISEGEVLLEYPFTDDAEVFRAQLRGLSASGGGSEPESTLDAVYVALQSPWREACNKCIVVFTDATCHERLAHPSALTAGANDVDDVINAVFQKKARIFLYAPDFHVYQALASAPRVQYEIVDGVGLSGVDFSKLLQAIGKTISSSTEISPAA